MNQPKGVLVQQRGRLHLSPPERELWRASEVPEMTARAMYAVGSKPPQRRTLVVVEHEGQPPPYALLTREHWADLRPRWRKAGLPAPADLSETWYRSIDDFTPYLIAANEKRGTRPWQLGELPSAAESEHEKKEFVQAALHEQHRSALIQELREGRIKAHRVSGPEASGWEALDQLVLSRDQVRRFAESLNILVEEAAQSGPQVIRTSLADESLKRGPTLTSDEICQAFDVVNGYRYWRRQIDKNLPTWLVDCREKKGTRGASSTEATWYPLMIAKALASGGKSRKPIPPNLVEKAFNNELLRDRKEEWTALRQNHSEWG